MKILVAIKRVVDHSVRVRPNSQATAMDIAGARMAINPFCEIALEEAVRLKEQGVANEIVVVSIGPEQAQEQLRAALALGADRAILVKATADLQPLAVAHCLQKLVEREQPRLIILGKQSIDGDNNQTGQMLAALCGYAQGTFASRLVIEGDKAEGGKARVTREVDGGLQTLLLRLPAVVTTDLRLNQPRYPSLPNIMKARQKPLAITTPDDLGVNITPRVRTLKLELPPPRQAGIQVKDVEALVARLQEAQLI